MRAYPVLRVIFVLVAALVIAYYFYSNLEKVKTKNVQLQGTLAETEKQWVKLRRQQGEAAFNKQKIIEIQREVKSVQKAAAEMEKVVKSQQDVISGLEETRQNLFLEHRKNVWKSGVGDQYREVTTPQGRTYDKVVITEVRSNEISFMFGVGAEGHSLPLERMPVKWVEKFLYTPAELKAAQDAAK